MRLPISDIISAALRDVWQGRRDFVGFAFLPVLALAAVDTAVAPLIGDPGLVIDHPDKISPDLVMRMFIGITIGWVVGLFVFTLFAVAWHRRTLVGPEATTFGAAMRWSRRHWRYFSRLATLVFYLLMFLFFLTVLLTRVIPPVTAMLVLVIAAGLIGGRAALVLPAAALDEPMPFVQSIRLTSGNSWRIMLAVIVVPLGLMLVGGIVVLLVAAVVAQQFGASLTAQFVLSLAAQTVNYVGFAVSLTALSLIYKHLTANAGPV